MPPDHSQPPASADPAPDAVLAELSQRLRQRIASEIDEQGPISFARYMQRALYEPGLGYYSAGLHKLGADGDFITAPEMGPVFGHCLARQLAQVLAGMENPVILEIGAGSGALAHTLLSALREQAMLPARYQILETSADLRQRQQHCLADWTNDPQGVEVEWLDAPPGELFDGVIVANEVIDALPVRCFARTSSGDMERRVGRNGEEFCWVECAADDHLRAAIANRLDAQGDALPLPYVSEYCELLPAWLKPICAALDSGLVLIIDYGYPRAEYYHPQRSMGTLICHQRHQAYDDPFTEVGLADITSFVDFTQLAEAADACGLSVHGFTTQADFLLGCGLEEELQRIAELPLNDQLEAMATVKRLTMPGEMGESFKVMALGRGLPSALAENLRGFAHADRRDRL